jgi:hypothetical protein
MIDITKIPTLARDFLAGLLDRNAAANSRFVDDLPTPPPGVDSLGWRIAQGHFRPDLPKRHKLETRGPDDWQARLR